MPKCYSLDLRESVLKHLSKNPDKHVASALFGIGIATVFRWAKRKKETGSVKALRREYAYKKIDDQALIKYVEEHPDHFLSEIGEHFSMSTQGIFSALRRLKITRKKKLLSIRRVKWSPMSRPIIGFEISIFNPLLLPV